jgi:hypothetical protein
MYARPLEIGEMTNTSHAPETYFPRNKMSPEATYQSFCIQISRRLSARTNLSCATSRTTFLIYNKVSKHKNVSVKTIDNNGYVVVNLHDLDNHVGFLRIALMIIVRSPRHQTPNM